MTDNFDLVKKLTNKKHADKDNKLIKDKKYLLVFIIAFFLIIVIVPTIAYLDFRNSPRYTMYQLVLSAKENDSELFHKYWDSEKMVDDLFAKEASNNYLSMTIYAGMKSDLLVNFKKSAFEGFKLAIRYEKLEEISNAKLFLAAFFYFRQDGPGIICKKINKNQIEGKMCNNKICSIMTFKKKHNKWMVTNIGQENYKSLEQFNKDASKRDEIVNSCPKGTSFKFGFNHYREESGIVITKIRTDSYAYEAGLRDWSWVLKINGEKIENMSSEEFRDKLDTLNEATFTVGIGDDDYYSEKDIFIKKTCISEYKS